MIDTNQDTIRASAYDSSNIDFQSGAYAKGLRYEEQVSRERKAPNLKDQGFKNKFEDFLNEIRLTSGKRSDEELFDEILKNVSFKSQGVLSEAQLARTFDLLVRKTTRNPRYGKINWTEEETNFLISVVAYYCSLFGSNFHSLNDQDWKYLSQLFPTKHASQLAKRWNSMLKVNLVHSPWTVSEDKLLAKLVAQYGCERQWKLIAEQLNLQLCSGTFRHARQCRERWNNYIDPRIKKGDWSQEEDFKLMQAFAKLGKKWSAIARALGDRNENAVRNRWNSLVKKVNQEESMKRIPEESEQNYELRLTSKYLEQASVSCGEHTGEMVSQNSKSTEEQATIFNNGYDYYDQSGIYQQINKSEYPEVEPTVPLWQADTASYDKQAENSTLYLKPILGFNQNVSPYDSYCWATEPYLVAQQPYSPVSRVPQSSEMCSQMPHRPFRVSSGHNTEEQFSKEVTKANSQVFYAMIDPTRNEIKLMEKVSGANWSKFMNYNTMYY